MRRRRRDRFLAEGFALPPEPRADCQVFPGMRIREENCNVILLVVVTLFTAAIAGGAALLKPAPAPVADRKPVHLADRAPVRVIGAPFVPNTNPRER
jgi:hypothetical protein